MAEENKSWNDDMEITRRWMEDLDKRLETENQRQNLAAFRAVLNAVREQLSPEDSHKLSTELPMTMSFEGWAPAAGIDKAENKDEFFERVKWNMTGCPRVEPEKAVKEVFDIIEKKIKAGEIKDENNAVMNVMESFAP